MRFLQLMRTRARWLKDTMEKESRFEKPYLDQEYRPMHFRPPTPWWPRTPPGKPWPPSGGPLWIFRWDPGMCFLGAVNADCGEEFSLGVTIGLVPPTLGGGQPSVQWQAVSSHPAQVVISSIEPSYVSYGATIRGSISDDFNETASICVSASIGGQILKEVVYESPFGYGPGYLRYRATGVGNTFGELEPVSEVWTEGPGYDCGCAEFVVDCNPCRDCDEETPVMTFVTQQMGYVDGSWSVLSQGLGIADYGSIKAECFTWEVSCVSEDCGTLSDATGYTTTYTIYDYDGEAEENTGCNGNPTITLKCNGIAVDTLDIAVNTAATGTGTGDAPHRMCGGGRISGVSNWHGDFYRLCDGILVQTGEAAQFFCRSSMRCDWEPPDGTCTAGCNAGDALCNGGSFGCFGGFTSGYCAEPWPDNVWKPTGVNPEGCCPETLL